jgi:hypothetical protein
MKNIRVAIVALAIIILVGGAAALNADTASANDNRCTTLCNNCIGGYNPGTECNCNGFPSTCAPGSSPDLTLERALDSTLDRLLDLAAATSQARG